jgi:DUF917 family protein
VSLALGIGRAILAARASGADTLAALTAELRRFDPGLRSGVLFEGKVVDVDRQVQGGFNSGTGTLRGIGGFTGSAEFRFQNEYLRIADDDGLLAIVPDLICFLDSETAEPVTCELLRYGQRIRVLGLSCAPVLRTERGLACCGPAAFGLREDYVPIRSC